MVPITMRSQMQVLPLVDNLVYIWVHICQVIQKGAVVVNKKGAQKKHKDISTIDQESKRTRGWYVRVHHCCKTFAKFFSDMCLFRAHPLNSILRKRGFFSYARVFGQ